MKKKLKPWIFLVLSILMFNSSVVFVSAEETINSVLETTSKTLASDSSHFSDNRVYTISDPLANEQLESDISSTYMQSERQNSDNESISTVKRFLSASSTHSVAINNNGTIIAWGTNNKGELGTSTITQIYSELSGSDTVSLGKSYMSESIFIKEGGTVWTCGREGGSSKLVQVRNLNNVVDVNYGATTCLALKSDGTVWVWGKEFSYYGEYGNGSSNRQNSTIPQQIPNLSNVKAISIFDYTCFAVLTDGTVWGWGSNNNRLIPDITSSCVYSPIKIEGLENIIDISAGSDFVVALKSDGTVWTWGKNEHGQLGNGSTTNISVPTQVNDLINVSQISTGALHTLALKSDGSVWAWGDNSKGQLGDYTIENRATPIRVKGIKNVKEISAGSSHSLFRESDGSIWGCGSNSLNRLLAEENFLTIPYPIFEGNVDNGNPGEIIVDMPTISQIYTGENHTLALCVDGTLWAWGNNTDGQLGVGNIGNQIKPVQITGISAVKTIVAGLNHTFIICDDGAVWTWGRNNHGQLGIGNTETQFIPVKIQ